MIYKPGLYERSYQIHHHFSYGDVVKWISLWISQRFTENEGNIIKRGRTRCCRIRWEERPATTISTDNKQNILLIIKSPWTFRLAFNPNWISYSSLIRRLISNSSNFDERKWKFCRRGFFWPVCEFIEERIHRPITVRFCEYPNRTINENITECLR